MGGVGVAHHHPPTSLYSTNRAYFKAVPALINRSLNKLIGYLAGWRRCNGGTYQAPVLTLPLYSSRYVGRNAYMYNMMHLIYLLQGQKSY